MSKVTKQLQYEYAFHSPIKQLQQQITGGFAYNDQQLNEDEKSIDSTVESQEQSVSNKQVVIKRTGFSKQTTVVATEAEYTPENKKDNQQSQDTEENSETKDYHIYQNGTVNEFFQNDKLENPQNVADICLVNDHYILVKMSDQEQLTVNHNNLAEAAKRRKEFRALKKHNDNILKEPANGNKKLCRYLRNKRSCIRKIAPIHEEPEDLSGIEDDKAVKTHSKLYCLKLQSCWQANEMEIETYETQTTIRKNIPNSACVQHQNMKQSSAPKPTAEKAESLDTRRPRDIQTISGSLLQSSAQCQVALRKHGTLIDSYNNNNIPALEMISSPKSRKCPRLARFHWLLHPFRGKHRKPKPKIQAVVYKTYFVKWTKPPGTLHHGYGAKSLKSSNVEMSILRRCRSAIF